MPTRYKLVIISLSILAVTSIALASFLFVRVYQQENKLNNNETDINSFDKSKEVLVQKATNDASEKTELNDASDTNKADSLHSQDSEQKEIVLDGCEGYDDVDEKTSHCYLVDKSSGRVLEKFYDCTESNSNTDFKCAYLFSYILGNYSNNGRYIIEYFSDGGDISLKIMEYDVQTEKLSDIGSFTRNNYIGTHTKLQYSFAEECTDMSRKAFSKDCISNWDSLNQEDMNIINTFVEDNSEFFDAIDKYTL